MHESELVIEWTLRQQFPSLANQTKSKNSGKRRNHFYRIIIWSHLAIISKNFTTDFHWFISNNEWKQICISEIVSLIDKIFISMQSQPRTLRSKLSEMEKFWMEPNFCRNKTQTTWPGAAASASSNARCATYCVQSRASSSLTSTQLTPWSTRSTCPASPIPAPSRPWSIVRFAANESGMT